MHKLFIFSIGLLTFLFTSYTNALQVKAVKDNQTIFAKISSKELNRLFVSHDRIQSVRGIEGIYQLIKDEYEGAIFIKPNLYYQKKAFNLFVTTEQGHTFTLKLRPLNIASENIEIKLLSPSKKIAEHWEKNSSYSELIIKLMTDMVNKNQPDGYAVIHLGDQRPINMNKQLSMRCLTIYRGVHLQGEVWKIKNNTNATLKLNGFSFYRKNVRAMVFEKETLAKGQETILYKVDSHD